MFWIKTQKDILTKEEFEINKTEKKIGKVFDLAPIEAYFKLSNLGFCKFLYLGMYYFLKLAHPSSNVLLKIAAYFDFLSTISQLLDIQSQL